MNWIEWSLVAVFVILIAIMAYGMIKGPGDSGPGGSGGGFGVTWDAGGGDGDGGGDGGGEGDGGGD